MSRQRIDFLENGAADSNEFPWLGGKGILTVQGNFPAVSSIVLQMSNINDVFSDLLPAIGDPGAFVFTAPKCNLKIILPGGTANALFVYGTSIQESYNG